MLELIGECVSYYCSSYWLCGISESESPFFIAFVYLDTYADTRELLQINGSKRTAWGSGFSPPTWWFLSSNHAIRFCAKDRSSAVFLTCELCFHRGVLLGCQHRVVIPVPQESRPSHSHYRNLEAFLGFLSSSSQAKKHRNTDHSLVNQYEVPQLALPTPRWGWETQPDFPGDGEREGTDDEGHSHSPLSHLPFCKETIFLLIGTRALHPFGHYSHCSSTTTLKPR